MLDKDEDKSIRKGEAMLRGEFAHFGSNKALFRGVPPNWHMDPFSGDRHSANQHWSRWESGQTDIKLVWELNRFAFAYSLVRDFWRTGQDDLPELFWFLVENWREENPPQAGANWKCGQEISFRLMAWLFGLYGFSEAAATTAHRVAMLAQMIAVSAHRIESGIAYALSQQNNHGVSEALGLWTVGTLFPEFRASARWEKKGRSHLESLGRKLIYDDGAFAQSSANYLRLVIHDYLWVLRLADLNGAPFSAELRERVGRAGELLYQLHDPASGRVPNFGQNDGALILPLSACDYQDFRPVTQAASYIARGTRCHGPGPWDEDLLWLFGPDSLQGEPQPRPFSEINTEAGAGCTLRSPSGFVFVRSGRFRHRPSQADLLHVDLWSKGRAVVVDAGTFSYSAPQPWDNAFAHTEYHNTVGVDGLDQMDLVSKFMWLPWAEARVTSQRRSVGGQVQYWEGAHNGYARLEDPVCHRRGILRLNDSGWIVIDHLQGARKHDYRLHWLFTMAEYTWTNETLKLVLQLPEGSQHVGLRSIPCGSSSLVSADPSSPRGWLAPFYLHREAALSLALNVKNNSVWFFTCFTGPPCAVEIQEGSLLVQSSDWRASLIFTPGQNTLVQGITLRGAVNDELKLSQ